MRAYIGGLVSVRRMAPYLSLRFPPTRNEHSICNILCLTEFPFHSFSHSLSPFILLSHLGLCDGDEHDLLYFYITSEGLWLYVRTKWNDNASRWLQWNPCAVHHFGTIFGAHSHRTISPQRTQLRRRSNVGRSGVCVKPEMKKKRIK